MSKEEQEREIREAKSEADILGRLDHLTTEVQHAVRAVVERERLGIVIVLIDPHAPPGMTAMVGGGNLTVAGTRMAVEAYASLLRRSGATEANKVRTPGIKQ